MTHAVVSTIFTVCARIVRFGMAPHTGALLQYMCVLDSGPASLSYGRCGLARNLGCTANGVIVALLFVRLASDGTVPEPEVELDRREMDGAEDSWLLEDLPSVRELAGLLTDRPVELNVDVDGAGDDAR